MDKNKFVKKLANENYEYKHKNNEDYNCIYIDSKNSENSDQEYNLKKICNLNKNVNH